MNQRNIEELLKRRRHVVQKRSFTTMRQSRWIDTAVQHDIQNNIQYNNNNIQQQYIQKQQHHIQQQQQQQRQQPLNNQRMRKIRKRFVSHKLYTRCTMPSIYQQYIGLYNQNLYRYPIHYKNQYGISNHHVVTEHVEERIEHIDIVDDTDKIQNKTKIKKQKVLKDNKKSNLVDVYTSLLTAKQKVVDNHGKNADKMIDHLNSAISILLELDIEK